MESHRVRHDLTTKQQHHNVKSMGVTYTAAAKSLQSCPTLCYPIDGSPPGSPVAGILQARTLEWVAISFSNAWKWKVKVKSLSRVWLFATPWTAAYQAPPSMGFSRQEYWNGVPLPSPDSHFAFLHFFSLEMVLITASCTLSQTYVHSSSGTLPIRSNPLNPFVISTV